MATMKKVSTGLRKLLEDQVSDSYYAEKQLLKALPKMAKAANNKELSTAFLDHAEETRKQIERLEQVFDALGKPAKGKKCPAIDGILEEGREIMEEFADDPALDAGLVAAGQKAEHYEIANYGSMYAWAEQLGMDEVAELLKETLEEEKGADTKLTDIAETVVNIEADDDDEDEDELMDSDKRSSKTGKSKATNGKSTAKAPAQAPSKAASTKR